MRMDLNFLGCGSAFNPLYGNTSAYFTNKDQLYVIDGGESVFLKLYQKELLKKYAGITIMVTHMHADHVGSLPSIIPIVIMYLGKSDGHLSGKVFVDSAWIDGNRPGYLYSCGEQSVYRRGTEGLGCFCETCG